MSTYPHLNKPVQKIASLTYEERIKWLRKDRWIGYKQAQTVLKKLEELLHWPKKNRMPNLLILGTTNNGKTTIVEKFISRHPPVENSEEGRLDLPVLGIQAPPGPDENRFYNSILNRLCAPYKASDNAAKKQQQVINILQRLNTKLILIDEIHHIIAGPFEKQRYFMNVIKYLGNELRVPIVGVGTKEALRAIQSDPQLANRFEPIALPKWEMNRDFQQLLASFEHILPLQRPSNLHKPPLAMELLILCDGQIGELSELLNQATKKAILHGDECITLELIRELDWVKPSQRRKHVERLLQQA